MWYMYSMTRKKSFLHSQLQVLSRRSHLDDKTRNKLEKLSLGFAGEQSFDQVIEPYIHTFNLIHVKDLLFKYDNGEKEVQIDNIVISNDTCYIFEVKKYHFNLKIDNRGLFFYEEGKEHTSLNTQIERQKAAINELLKDIGYPMTIKHYLVFINPDRTVFGLQREHSVLTQNTLHYFLEIHMRKNREDYSYFLPLIDSRRLPYSKYDHFYEIDLDKLAKGVYCENCDGRMKRVSNRIYYCEKCEISINTLTAIRHLIQDLNYINPTFKLNSVLLSRLSGKEISSSIIRKYRQEGKIIY